MIAREPPYSRELDMCFCLFLLMFKRATSIQDLCSESLRQYDEGYEKKRQPESLSTADSSNSLKRDYFYFNGVRLGWVTIASGDPHYYLKDHLGSPRVIANGDGSVVSWEADYRPYGADKVISNGDGLDVFYLFTGYEFDYEMGTSADDYYANLRYQSASLGRFFQPDPVGGDPTNPQSWNRYAYALNNPLNLIDPSGLCNHTVYSTDEDGNVHVDCLDPTGGGGGGGGGIDPSTLCVFYGICPGGLPTPLPGPDGGGGGGGGGGNDNPKPQPQPQPKKSPLHRIDCANKFANNHSLAALFGAQNTFLGKALGGNAVAGLGELYVAVADKSGTNPVSLGASIAVGGAGLGVSPVGGPGIKGATGIVQDAVVKGTASAANNAIRGIGSTPITLFTAESTLAAESAAQLSTQTLEDGATGVGLVKLVADVGIYAYGLSQCTP